MTFPGMLPHMGNATRGHGVCNECGWNTPGFKPIRLPTWHFSRWLPVLVACGLVAALFIVRPKPTSWSSGVWPARFVEPGWTADELQEVADGKRPGDELIASLRRERDRNSDIFGAGHELLALFRPSAGDRNETTTRGWPTPWFIESRTTHYADPLRRTGRIDAYINPALPVPSAFESRGGPEQGPRPASQWVGWMMYVKRPDPATTGGVDVRTVYFLWALPAIIGLWMAAFVITAGASLLIEKLSGARPSMKWAVVLAFIIVVGVNALPEKRDPPPSAGVKYVAAPNGAFAIPESAAPIGLRKTESDPLESRSDAEIAGQILAAVRAKGVSTEGRLVVIPTSPGVIGSTTLTGYPAPFPFLIYREIPYVGFTDLAPQGPLAPPWRWRVWSMDRELIIAWIGPGTTVRQLGLAWDAFFVVAIGFLLIACWRIWLLWPFVAWRLRKRLRRGECPECGHPLSTPPAKT